MTRDFDDRNELLRGIQNWVFEEWEPPFIAMAGDRYIKDIMNYGGDIDRLYVKELNITNRNWTVSGVMLQNKKE